MKRTMFKKLRTETILKIYNTLVLPTFLYRSEKWTLTALQRRRTEAAEMKILRPLAGYTFYDHKTNDYIRHELRITGILDKIDEYRRYWHSHLQWMPQNRISLKSYHYRPQGRRTIGRSVGASSCNSGDGTDQRVQSLMFMMMMMTMNTTQIRSQHIPLQGLYINVAPLVTCGWLQRTIL
jgi:hypothetical protein